MGAAKPEPEEIEAAQAALTDALLALGNFRYAVYRDRKARGVSIISESRIQRVSNDLSGVYNLLLRMQEQ